MNRKPIWYILSGLIAAVFGAATTYHGTAQSFTNLHNFTAVSNNTNSDGSEPLGV